MKTCQILVRKMKDLDVLQRTSDGMFNATELLKEWNKTNLLEKRELDNFWKSTHLDKLMSEIAENELDFKSVDFTELKKTLSKTSRGKYSGGTWMHPILFIKFAMYLSPKFEYHVLKFVSDQLIAYRNEAGESYKQLSAAISIIVDKKDMAKAMSSVAKAINYVIYNKHERLLRNKQADELLLKDLCELQKDIAKLINFGFISSYDQLRNFLRKMWVGKWQPNELIA